MITDVEDYFSKGCGRCDRFATPDCSTRKWNRGLADLRRICLASGLLETAKWGHPCYMHSGRNIAILGAFRGDFRISFFNAALLKDPAGVLTRQGQNSRHPDAIRFTDNGQVAAKAALVESYLKEALSYAAAGIKPAKESGGVEPPDELAAAMASDPELAEAFHNLTPGRKRGYVLHLASAKTSATRLARIARARHTILAGKGVTER
jgi:uncharacterized protein YdeI (YjbR/CyaY-like superfamily)